MLNPLKLKLEIALTLGAMRNASDSQREYLIGQLSALLWVQADGDMPHTTAFRLACETWDKQRSTDTRFAPHSTVQD